jgi:hypothetical protein
VVALSVYLIFFSGLVIRANFTVEKAITGPSGQGVSTSGLSYDCSAGAATVQGHVTGYLSGFAVEFIADNSGSSPTFASAGTPDFTVGQGGNFDVSVPLESSACSSGAALYAAVGFYYSSNSSAGELVCRQLGTAPPACSANPP